MNVRDEVNKVGGFKNLPFLAKQVVEGFISGMHKSPFHGFLQNLLSISCITRVKVPDI